ncbi:hypothetical protein B1790_05365 [Mycobacterium sp. AT1]|nr:hypothetical protein B1790_05365 [Mycobacterium sp. AT1]
MQLRLAITADGAFFVEMARYACVIEDRPLPAADSEEVLSLVSVVGGRAIVAADTGAVMPRRGTDFFATTHH